MQNDKPIFNLKVVLRETGIKADVLRAWERRYGLPKPQRSPGGHRLYSQRDIATIKWLIARQSEGLSISRAVELWHAEESASRDPLEEMDKGDQVVSLARMPVDVTLDELKDKWLGSCMAFNETAAEDVLNQAFSIFPVEKVVMNVIQKGMSEMGSLWFNNHATVQQEHFTSALAMRRIETLLTAAPLPNRKQTVILACPSEEWHTFPLAMIYLFLRRRGIHVVFLGANVPAQNLNEAVSTVKPNLVILAAQHLVSASNLQRLAQTITDMGFQTAFGGRIFNTIPDLKDRIPGHFLGETIEESLLSVEMLLSSPQPVSSIGEVSPEYKLLAREFKEKRGLVETKVIENLKAGGIVLDYIDVANLYLGNELASALQLGDLDFLTSDMAWIKGLLERNNVPSQALSPYLKTYGEAVRQVMNGHSDIFIKWIQSITQ